MNPGTRSCRRCGAALNPSETRGLCPACLLESSLRIDDDPDSQASIETVLSERNQLGAKPDPAAQPHRLGDYELFEEIGRGGMGVIYRARQVSLDRLVAVKTILTGPLASPDFTQRFQTEAHAAAVLEHSNIVPIYEVGNHHGQPFYSMRLITGRNLAQELKETGAMPPRRAAALVATVARAVHYAHQRGVLHRDLKPANILLDAEGNPHVTDFGLAKLLEQDDGLTLTQAALGTPNYMAPEQAAGNMSALTTAADVYSLGAILFEVLTGKKLFTAATPLATINCARDQEPPKPSSILRLIPRDLDTICWKCLEKEPHRRYASAQSLADDLEHWLAGEPIRARRVGTVERMGLWCRRKPALAGMAGAALLALMAVSGLSAWRLTVAREAKELEQYAANISLADSAIRGGSMDRALDYLTKCPEPLRHWEWGRLLFECLQEVSTIPAHTNRPQFLMKSLLESMAFNSQGTLLSSKGLDGTLAVWDPITGREMFRVGNATNQVTASFFRSGRNEIAVGRSDGSVEILDSESGRLVSRLIQPHRGWTNRPAAPVVGLSLDVYDTSPIRDPLQRRPWAVVGMDWSRTGGRIVIVQADGAVRIRELEGTAKEWTWSPVAPGLTVKAWFTPDDAALVIQSPGLAQRFDPATGRELGALQWDPPTGGASGVWVSPSAGRLIHIDREGRATLRDASGVVADLGPLIQRNANALLTAFFSRDGSLFCTTGDVGTARVFRADTGKVLFALPETVYGGAFSAEGDQLAVFGLDRIVRIWDMHHRLEVRPLRGHLSSITGVIYAPGGRLLATASREGVVKVWSARHHGRILFGDTLVSSSGYSPDGRWLATAPCFRGLWLWEGATGRLQWKVPSRTQSTYMPVFCPDGRLIYSGGSDRCVRIYQVADGRPAGMLRGHQRSVWALHCSPDGRYVATGDHGGVLKIWDAQTRRELHSFAAHPAGVWSIFFDPHSRFLVTAGTGKPRVWEVATGRLVVELDEDGVGAYQAVFSPDGRHVVAACLDNYIRHWEVPSGRLASRWTSQSQGASFISYGPDGVRFTLPVADMTSLGVSLPKLEIWDAEHGRPLLNLEAHRESIFTAQFDPSGRRLVTASMDTTVRQWEAFPWRDTDYPEPRGGSLEERVRHFARQYWRERVAQTEDASAAGRMSAEAPLPPGIPDWERDRWPQRDSAAGPLQINLDRYYTGVLDALFYPSWTDMEYDDDLSSLPTGLQRFGGVLFDVRGVIWLRSELPNPADPTFRATCHDFPERVEGIAIGRKFQKLHVLHAATTYDPRFLSSPQANADRKQLVVGAYVLHYADGTRHEHEIQYGLDLRNWWWGGRGDDAAEAERAKVAWVGTNGPSARYEAKVRLFLSTFENPRPDVEVVSVDFLSKQTPFAPFLVAMTIEP